MIGQRALDLFRVNGLAAGKEPVVAAPDDGQVAVLVYAAEVAGGEPAVVGQGTSHAVALDVAHEQGLSGQLDLPLVPDPQLPVRQQLPRGEALSRSGFRPRRGHLRGHLRAAVAGEHREAALARPFQQLQRNRAAAQDDVAERRVAHRLRLLQQTVKLGHHHRKVRDLVTAQDPVQGLSPVRHHHGGSGQQATEQDAEPAHVIERQVQQPAVAGGQRQVPVGAQGVVVVVAVGVEHRLGSAGAAGGEDDGGGTGEGHGGNLAILPRLRLQRGVAGGQVAAPDDLQVARHVAELFLLQRLRPPASQVPVRDKVLRDRVVKLIARRLQHQLATADAAQKVRHRALRQSRVHGTADGAHAQDGQQPDEVVRAVGSENGHALAGAASRPP